MILREIWQQSPKRNIDTVRQNDFRRNPTAKWIYSKSIRRNQKRNKYIANQFWMISGEIQQRNKYIANQMEWFQEKSNNESILNDFRRNPTAKQIYSKSVGMISGEIQQQNTYIVNEIWQYQINHIWWF